MDFIRRAGNGTDLIIETTLIDNSGNGITTGLTVTASIQRMSDGNYWTTTPAFDSATESSLHTLTHIREGLYAFTLVTGAEDPERQFRIHLVVTGNPQVNHNATESDIILAKIPTAAEVNAEVDTALADIHLDHLFAVDYDPASKPGVATALFNELIEDDGGVSRYTANALEQSPGDATLANQTAISAALLVIDDIVDEILVDTTTGGAGPWTSANTDADITKILGVAITEGGAGRLAAAFSKFLDVATPARDVNDIGDLQKIEGSTTIDGLTITKYFEKHLAYFLGKMLINNPDNGKIKFLKQNEIDEAFTHLINSALRQLISSP